MYSFWPNRWVLLPYFEMEITREGSGFGEGKEGILFTNCGI